jgi:hypothetical protein
MKINGKHVDVSMCNEIVLFEVSQTEHMQRERERKGRK